LGETIAFAVPSRYPAVFSTVPVFDEAMLFNGQMRLPLRLPVLVPQERTDFLANLLERSSLQPIAFKASIFAEPLAAYIPPRIVVLRPALVEQPSEQPNVARAPVITPLMLQVEKIVQRLATAYHPMPSNPILGEQAGGKGRGVVARALMRLEQAGRLVIEIAAGKRRVVMPNGATTSWGDFAVGVHRPYSRRAKGSAPEAKPTRLDYKPEGEEPFRYKIQPQRLVPTGPAPTCQWPTWADGIKPSGTHSVEGLKNLFCGDRSESGRSYCKRHVGDAFVPNPTKTKRTVTLSCIKELV
jgi:hypothetical protein